MKKLLKPSAKANPSRKVSQKKSKKAPQPTSAKAKLTPRQKMFLKGIAELKPQEQAALDAGYSPSVARSACRILEGPKVRAELQKILRKWVDPDKIGQRIAEGLDAMETRFCQWKGVVSDSREVIAWGERLAYIEMAAKYAGYYVDGQEVAAEHVSTDPEADEKRLEELFALATAGDPGREP